MSEISREEYKTQLKNHDYWCHFSWQDDICIQALKDREKLEKIEKIFEIKGFGEYPCTYEDMCREVIKIVKE